MMNNPFSLKRPGLAGDIWGGLAAMLVALPSAIAFGVAIFSPLAGDFQVAYLLPADRYGKGLYQEEPSILASGCLEILIEAVAERIQALR